MLFQAADAASLRDAAAAWIETQSQPFTIAARTRALASDTLRHAKGPGQFGARRFGWSGFVARLADPRLRLHQLRRMGPLGTEAVTTSALRHAADQQKLRHFLPIAHLPGFPRALASTLLDLRLHAVTQLPATSPALSELQLLLDLYQQELETQRLADPARIFQFALEAQPPSPLLLLDPPTDSRADRLLIDRLTSQGAALLQLAPSDAEPRTRLESARRQIFLPQVRPAVPPDDSIVFFSAPAETLECTEIARRLLNLARQGQPFDRCAILLRDRASYQPLLEDALRRASIPAYFSRATLRPHPAGRALLALLRCAHENYSSLRFEEYLSFGQARYPGDVAPVLEVPPDDEWLDPNPDPQPLSSPAPELPIPRRWERLIEDARILEGLDRWPRRLDGLAGELQRRRRELPDPAFVDQDLDHLANLKQFALPLLDLLAAHPDGEPWSAWLDWLDRLTRTTVREPEPVLAILAELEPMKSVGPLDLGSVLRVLRPRLAQALRPQPESPAGCVFVSSIQEARGRAFDIVFLPGLAEGVFPRRATEDPLLLDESRRLLDAELPLRSDHIQREHDLLRAALQSAARRLFLSYARSDTATGRPRVPSFYALEILRAADGHLPDLSQIEPLAAREVELSSLWPAPKLESSAIDEFEFDLARSARARRGELPAGSLHYLMQVNPHAARSLRAIFRRAKRDWTQNDGFLVPREDLALLRESLEAAAPETKAYSPSSLERYAHCPYQFYLGSVLQLRPREDAAPATHLEPILRGSLFHEALDRFFKRVSQFPVAEDLALSVLNQCFDEASRDIEDQVLPANPSLWRSEMEDVRLDLHGWLTIWREQRLEWRPLHSEFPFKDAKLLDGFLVTGKIDLIEKKHSELRVTDFKTGRPAKSPGQVDGGRKLQPALYAAAAQQTLGHPVTAARLFYATQRGAYTEHSVKLNAQTFQSVQSVLDCIAQDLTAGRLLPAPNPGGCAYCDFQLVCGPAEERRLRQKDLAKLECLQQVRSLP